VKGESILRHSFSILTLIAAGLTGAAANAGFIACDADLDGSGTVNGLDLASLLAAWGPCGGCPSDFNGSGTVDGLDLAQLLSAWGTSGCGAGGAGTEAELAGNSLAGHPFFEYVTAFNQGSNIKVALDPTRYPAIVGETCNVYIVANKTAAQWAGDGSLTDVTGGFQTESFVAGTIQANTFTVSGSSGLNGTTGEQVGIPYDMVCDCNQNGQLDGGDYIDGLGDAGGLYVVRDTAAPGPYAVTELTYTVTPWTGTAGFANENTFYPTNIASLGPRPLIIVSHGNGHQYIWYDHLGTHMASYGYVLMSHQNNTVPGVIPASTTTLEHTNAFVSQVASAGAPGTPALAPIDGLVDVNNIMWIGHSRGGEGVALAYDRVFDGAFIPVGWDLSDLKLVSSIAPVDFQGGTANPGFTHGGPYHLWTGSSDADVNGCANCNLCQTYHLHDRAEGYRQSITNQGTGHGDYHNGGGSSVAAGPCLVGRPRTHQMMRGYLLPLAEHYFDNDIPSKDFLWRQWESFKPIGAPATAVCAAPSGTGVDVVNTLMYRDGPAAGNFMIDNFESQASTATSSSGGTVTMVGLAEISENRADDNNADFTWSAADLMNAATLAGTGDNTTRILVFSYAGAASLEWSVIGAQQDLTDDAYLSFRAAQMSRHPNVTAALADLTFNVVLRDADGTTGSINVGAYGGGIEEPYQRTTCGVGAGWHAEFETVRIRLTDFTHNNPNLDLGSITAVRFEFGGAGVSNEGRLGVDEIEIVKN
jgi:hypothetical protein